MRFSQWSPLGPLTRITSEILLAEQTISKVKQRGLASNDGESDPDSTTVMNNAFDESMVHFSANPAGTHPTLPSLANVVPGQYHDFISCVEHNSGSTGNLIRPNVSYLEAVCASPSKASVSKKFPLIPCADPVHTLDSELLLADWISLLRDSRCISSGQTVIQAQSVLCELQDWSTRGLLEVEPLRVAEDNSMHRLPADCVLERVNLCKCQIPYSNSSTIFLAYHVEFL